MIYDNILILAQAAAQTPAPAAAGGGGSPTSLVIPIVCGLALMYFMMIRPQNQKQKQQQELINSVKTGDKVVTAGGMHGLVANVKETTVIVKVADNVKIEVDKTAISVVTKRTENDPAPAA